MPVIPDGAKSLDSDFDCQECKERIKLDDAALVKPQQYGKPQTTCLACAVLKGREFVVQGGTRAMREAEDIARWCWETPELPGSEVLLNGPIQNYQMADIIAAVEKAKAEERKTLAEETLAMERLQAAQQAALERGQEWPGFPWYPNFL